MINTAAIAEQDLLGCFFFPRGGREAALIADCKIQPEDIDNRLCRKIYIAALELARRGDDIDLASMYAALAGDKDFDEAGDITYLAGLVQRVPSPGNVDRYCEIIRAASDKRRLARICGEQITALAGDTSAAEAGACIMQHIQQLQAGAPQPQRLQEQVRGVLDWLRQPPSVATVHAGIGSIDKIITSFAPGGLTVIAARPAMGKSALGLTIALNNTLGTAIPGAYISLEMSASELLRRAISRLADVPGGALQPLRPNAQQWRQIAESSARLAEAPLHIIDNSSGDLDDIITNIRVLQYTHHIQYVIIDYLQLMHSSRKTNNREQEVSTITRQLKLLALNCKIPIILLSQLNRACESREDKRPRLGDLRESGAIEQDADNVLFIHRAGYYNITEPQDRAEIIIAKQRNGTTGSAEVCWRADITSFCDVDNDRF